MHLSQHNLFLNVMHQATGPVSSMEHERRMRAGAAALAAAKKSSKTK